MNVEIFEFNILFLIVLGKRMLWKWLSRPNNIYKFISTLNLWNLLWGEGGLRILPYLGHFNNFLSLKQNPGMIGCDNNSIKCPRSLKRQRVF